MIDAINKLFYTITILTEKTMIFYHGADAEVRSEIGDLTNGGNQYRQGIIETFFPFEFS